MLKVPAYDEESSGNGSLMPNGSSFVLSEVRERASGTRFSVPVRYCAPARHCSTMSYSVRWSAHPWNLGFRSWLQKSHSAWSNLLQY